MAALLDVPADLASIQGLLTDSLTRVERRFNDALRSDLPPVERLCRHVERYRGKMLRPALVILAGLAVRQGGAGGGDGRNGGGAAGNPVTPADITEDQITLAAVCEMIHMATLVHDDVLDGADTRRSGETVNRLVGNEAAVILGDYLFSAAYRLCSTLDSQAAALLIGTTGMSLCSGELLQLHHRANFSIDEETYFEIVRRKTASLIATACKLGAMTEPRSHAASTSKRNGAKPPADATGQSPDGSLRSFAEALHTFGLALGIAFQIQDDLLDLTGTETVVGKPVRRDLEMGKLTLPLIHHLAAATPRRRGATLDLLGRHSNGHAAAAAHELVAALNETDSIHHARHAAAKLVDQAKSALAPIPDSPAKQFLLLMADAVITRAF